MNPNSTEDYLDSLLRAIQQKDNPVPESEVQEPEVHEIEIPETEELSETSEIPMEEELPEILELPEEEELPEILELPEEEELPEILELPEEEELPEILELPEEEELPEILELPMEEELMEILELPTEEDFPEILEIPEETVQKQEDFVTADEPMLDVLLGDPNKALSPEEIQAMFAQVEEIPVGELPVEEFAPEELPVEEFFTEELPIEEFVAEEIPTEQFDIDDELPPLEEVLGRFADDEAVDLSLSDEQISVSDELNLHSIKEELNLDELYGGQIEEEVVEDASAVTGQEMFADEIQNLSEDDILSLLQQSSDVETDEASIDALFGEESESTDLDALLENMSEDSEIAGLQDLFEKSENNEPVSSEVEEMIELGLKVDEEPIEVKSETDGKPGLFGKLKGKLFSKKSQKKKEESEDSVELFEKAVIEEKDSTQETMGDESSDISELLNFAEESNMDEFINLTEGTTSLEDLMAETGGLDFGGMQNNAAETFSFDQLFEDTSNVQADNSEMSDISGLLKSLESAEGQSDIFDAGDDLFASMNSEEGIETIEGLLEGTEEEPKKEKKPGLFSRFITFLTAEDEDEDSDGLNGDGVEKLGVTSEENKEALEQLDKEGNGKKKKKKKGKKDETAEEELDEDEEPQDDKKKKKRAKKEKKQKEPKLVEDVNEPVLSKKKVRSTFLFAFTLMAAILICCLFVPDLFEKKSARNAFYDGDYETCYQSLYGKKLSESDRLIFEKAGFMLALERRTDAYDNYMAVGDELRALESLIQEVAKQNEVMRNAESYELTTEAEQSYQELLNVLSERYQVSETDALTINAYKQDALFTLHLKAIVAGDEFVCPDYLKEDGQASEIVESAESTEKETSVETLEDMLPVEEELTETEFEEGTN